MTDTLDLATALMAGERWHGMTLAKDFTIIAGGDSFRSAAGNGQFLDTLTEESRGRFVALAGSGTGGGGTFRNADGAFLELVVASLGGEFAVFYRDPAGRLNALERLALFYRHFQTTPTAICLTDPEGSILEANSSFLDLYGYTSAEVVGKNPSILKSGRQSPEAYQRIWSQITDPQLKSWSGEMVNRKKNGEEVEVHLTVCAVRDGLGENLGYIASTLDLTPRKLMERELLSSNQELRELNRLKSDLMAITSHDLKSPLNAMVSRARMLRELTDELPQAKREEQIDKIIDAGGKMASFIDELLDLEKMEQGRYRLATARLHLDTLLSCCVETNLPSARDRGVSLVLRVEGVSEPIRADLTKLEQLFNNIISNAIKFSSPGDLITVTCHDKPGKKKRVTIADQGPGIPEQDLPHIFDRYFQVKRSGSSIPGRVYGAGLGLSIVSHIAKLHGGSVSAANRSGGGCSFLVQLPARVEATCGEDLAALIIDPCQEIYAYLERPLRQKGVSCYFARNLQEVCRIQQRERPDLVFAACDSLSEEIREYLAARRAGALQVGIAGQVTHPAPLHRMLVPPVVDLEIFELLNELLPKANQAGR
jgi:PAS domain S-box-containing protein